MHLRRVVVLSSFALALAALLPAFAGATEAISTISASALLQRIDAGDAPLILDVRTESEYASGHVPGAIHIPYDEVAERLGELGQDRGREIVVYCESGKRAGRAESTLQSKGFTDLVHLEGDMRGWREKGLRCEGDICGDVKAGEGAKAMEEKKAE